MLLFHGGFAWAKGGYLGVTVFFVLSGFLITSLLLAERERTGGISLRAFWARRARRLAPAILVLIALAAAFEHWGVARRQPQVFGDALAALGWVSNWRFLLGHRVYADLFSTPSPFTHTWSLAIEEQFYLLVALLAVVFIARGPSDTRGRKAIATFGLLAILYAALVPFGVLGFKLSTDALYYRTDIRMAEPLVGVLLALVLLRKGRIVQLSDAGRRIADGVGLAGLALVAFCVVRLGEHSPVLFKGGLLATSVGAAAVVASATQRGTVINRALAWQPLVALGKISYGVYLFHWPLDLWLSPLHTGLSSRVALFSVRTAVALAVATASYFAIEQPIRRGSLKPARVALVGWANGAVGTLALLLAVTLVVPAHTTLLAQGDKTGPFTSPPTTVPPQTPAATTTSIRPVTQTTVRVTTATTRKRTTNGGGGGGGGLFGPIKPAAPPPTIPAGDPNPPLKVAVVGDSMANSLAKGLTAWSHERTDVSVYDLSILGCPLSRGSSGEDARRTSDGQGGHNPLNVDHRCFWWDPQDSGAYPDQLAKYQEFNPDVVVIQDGMNEVPDRRLSPNGDYHSAGDPSFDNYLINEYGAVYKRFTDDGHKVVFLNTVCADWVLIGHDFENYEPGGEGDRRVSALNRDDTAAGLARGFAFADFNARICPNGRFSQTIEGVPDARDDGYHITSVDASTALARNWLGPLIFQAAGKPMVAS